MFCGFRTWFVLLIGLCLIAATYQLLQQSPKISDSAEYLAAAHNLLENNTLYSGSLSEEIDFRLYSKRTLGYPLFLIMQKSIPVSIHLAQIGLLILNFFLGLFIIVRLNPTRTVFALYCVLFLFTPVIYFHSFFVLADLLLMSIVTTMVLLTIESKLLKKKNIFLFSALWGVALLIKPVILPSLLLIPIIWIFFYMTKKQGHYFLIIPAIFWLAMGLLNYSNTHVFETSSISTINLTQYNAKLTIANKFGYDSAQKFTEHKSLIVPKNEYEYARYKEEVKQLGVNTIQSNLGAYLKVHIIGIAKMLLDPGRFELYTFFGEETSNISLTEMLFDGSASEIEEVLTKRPILLLLFFFLFLINILKLFGALGVIRKLEKSYLLMLGLVIYFLFLTGPIGAARFFLPVTPLYIILVSVGWSNLLQKGPKR